mmetsp:Transcript_1513/g.3186  ORF Transcript_1513/g.3186 Transcript_1513/m.3186 type:complete len:96 (-) Transcript_1513:120-407(-)
MMIWRKIQKDIDRNALSAVFFVPLLSPGNAAHFLTGTTLDMPPVKWQACRMQPPRVECNLHEQKDQSPTPFKQTKLSFGHKHTEFNRSDKKRAVS